jgi:hypothetical protein
VKQVIGFGINSVETLIKGQNALLAAQQARKVISQRSLLAAQQARKWNTETLKH